MSFWKGVKGSKGYCTVNPHPDACLINPARGYPGSLWSNRAARQGSKLFSSGWSPSCLGSSKNEGKPSAQNILGLSPVDTRMVTITGWKQTLGWRLLCRKFIKEWPWGQQRKRKREDEQREKPDANAVSVEASPDPGPSGSSENGMSFQSCPEQGEGSSLPPLLITYWGCCLGRGQTGTWAFSAWPNLEGTDSWGHWPTLLSVPHPYRETQVKNMRVHHTSPRLQLSQAHFIPASPPWGSPEWICKIKITRYAFTF